MATQANTRLQNGRKKQISRQARKGKQVHHLRFIPANSNYSQVAPPTQSTGSQGAAPLPQDEEEEGAFQEIHPPKYIPIVKWSKAYFGSLIAASVAFPIIATAATVCFYFTPSYHLPFIPPDIYKALETTNWYSAIYGFIFALIATMIFALLRISFATAVGGNIHNFGMLKSRQSALKARLGIQEGPKGEPRPMSLSKMKKATGMTTNDRCSESALREAYTAYDDIWRNLFYGSGSSGLKWVLGMGYVNTWELIHRSEEALIEVVPIQTIIREAMDDQEAIENSAINNSDDLLEKLIQSVKDLDPGASPYFKEHQPDKNYQELQQELKEQRAVLETLIKEYNSSHPDHQIPSLDNNVAPTPEVERRARGALREVRQVLNTYREGLWEGLVRARNHLLTSITLTGIATFILLCIPLLLDTSLKSNKAPILAATAFYLVGAVAGLFGRFYSESISEHANDDYGLFTARLIAVPLLSGLAGIGGVLITVLLPVLSGQTPPSLDKIFTLNTEYLFSAAVFGFTPNLLIQSFQQRAQKFQSELESSKATGSVSSKN